MLGKAIGRVDGEARPIDIGGSREFREPTWFSQVCVAAGL